MGKRMDDYLQWHHHQVKTGDIDPAYPVLRDVGQALGGGDAAAWLCLTHVAYYNMASALYAISRSPIPVLDPALYKLPTGTERRAHRDVRQFHAHWTDLVKHVEKAGGPRAWLTPKHSGVTGWNELQERILAVHGNGRWAAYKLAELSSHVIGTKITAPDASHAHSSGPRKGLEDLYRNLPTGNTPADVATLDRYTERLQRKLGEPDIARVETSLCDFHSAVKGKYYIGKDIDEQLHQLGALTSDLTPVAMAARQTSFPHSYLGELHGWAGVDKERCKAYRDTGRILLR